MVSPEEYVFEGYLVNFDKSIKHTMDIVDIFCQNDYDNFICYSVMDYSIVTE